jgi:hypothetical protein
MEEASDVSEEPAPGNRVYVHIQDVPFMKINKYKISFKKLLVDLISH